MMPTRLKVRRFCSASQDQPVELGGVHPAVQATVDGHRRPERAVPEAEDLIEGDRPVCRGVAEVDVQGAGGVVSQGAATHGLARLAPADLDPQLPRRGRAQVRIEGQHTVNVGAGEVQRLRHERNRTRVDIPEGLLEGVQHGQQRSALRGVGTDRLQGHLMGERGMSLVVEHGWGTPSAGWISPRIYTPTVG